MTHLSCELGYCLVLDCGEGRLAYELARRTQLKVVGVESDAGKVEKARRLLDQAGLSGRVAIHHCTVSELPLTSFFANVVVSDGMLGAGKRPDGLGDIARLVRPYGGVLLLGEPANSDSESAMQRWAQGVVFLGAVQRDGRDRAGFRIQGVLVHDSLLSCVASAGSKNLPIGKSWIYGTYQLVSNQALS